jgi:hypothetical protein
MSDKEEQVEVKVRGTKRLQCSCYHPWQDKKYGKGIRLHNRSNRDSKRAYCTVCGMMKTS